MDTRTCGPALPEWPAILGLPMHIQPKPDAHSPSVTTVLSEIPALGRSCGIDSQDKVLVLPLSRNMHEHKKKFFTKESNQAHVYDPDMLLVYYCGSGVSCTGARATKKCYNCIKYVHDHVVVIILRSSIITCSFVWS